MRRGDIYVATASVTVCPLTTHDLTAPLMRLELQPSHTNGLSRAHQIMIDQVTSIPRASVRERPGELEAADLVRLNRAMIVFLGLAG